MMRKGGKICIDDFYLINRYYLLNWIKREVLLIDIIYIIVIGFIYEYSY